MGRWLIAILVGAIALGGVFFLWQRQATRDATVADINAPAPGAVEAPPDPGSEEQTVEQPSPPAVSTPEPSASSANAEGTIVVDEPWARPAAAQGSTNVSLMMTNSGLKPDRIVQVSSPDADSAVLQMASINAKSAAQAKPAGNVELEPGVPLAFEPGGLSVVLIGLKHKLKTGDTIALVFVFEHAGTLRVSVPVSDEPSEGGGVAP